MVDADSFGFKGSISDYINKHVLYLHSREHEGWVKYDFPVRISIFSIRNEITSGLDKLLRYNQGNGITISSNQYNDLKYNLRFEDIFNGEVQLLEKINPSFQHPYFFIIGGRGKDPRVYVPIYQSFLKMVHGNGEHTQSFGCVL